MNLTSQLFPHTTGHTLDVSNALPPLTSHVLSHKIGPGDYFLAWWRYLCYVLLPRSVLSDIIFPIKENSDSNTGTDVLCTLTSILLTQILSLVAAYDTCYPLTFRMSHLNRPLLSAGTCPPPPAWSRLIWTTTSCGRGLRMISSYDGGSESGS